MNASALDGAPGVDPYRKSAPPTAALEPLELGPRYAAVRVHTQCPACIQPVPINGPLRELTCSRCGAPVVVEDRLFKWVADEFESKHAALTNQASMSSGEVDELRCVDKPGDDWVWAEAPAWLKSLAPTAHRVWLPKVRGRIVEPIAFACPGCCAGMRVDAQTPRVSRCTGCNARVFLPEALWSELHGVPVVDRWVIEFRGENRFDRRRRRDARRAALDRANEEAARRRDAHARARKMATEARSRAAEQERLRKDVLRLSSWARRTNAAQVVVAAVAIAWPWIAVSLATGESWPHVANFAAALLMYIMGFVAVGSGARVISRVSGRGDLTFSVWFNIPFVLVFPVIGNLFAFEAAWGLRYGKYREQFGACAHAAARAWTWVGVTGLLFAASVLLAYLT